MNSITITNLDICDFYKNNPQYDIEKNILFIIDFIKNNFNHNISLDVSLANEMNNNIKMMKEMISNNFKEIKKKRQALVRKIETDKKKQQIKRLQEEVEKERLESIRAENEELEIIRAEKRAKAKIVKERHMEECPLQCAYCEKHVKKTYSNMCWDCFGELKDKCACGKYKKKSYPICYTCKEQKV